MMENKRPLNLMIVDDQASVRDGLATVFDIADDLHLVAAARDGQEEIQFSDSLLGEG